MERIYSSKYQITVYYDKAYIRFYYVLYTVIYIRYMIVI